MGVGGLPFVCSSYQTDRMTCVLCICALRTNPSWIRQISALAVAAFVQEHAYRYYNLCCSLSLFSIWTRILTFCLSFLTFCLSFLTTSGPIPAELGQLKDLTSVSLTGNCLTGYIPAELGELENLDVLQLSENELVGISHHLYSIRSIRFAFRVTTVE